MGSHIPSVERAADLVREAVGVAPIGEGLNDVNLITVALSAAVRSGHRAQVLLKGLQDNPRAWGRLEGFLQCLCLLDAEAVIDLLVHPDALVREKAWGALVKYGDSRLVEPLRERLAQESAELQAPMPAALARLTRSRSRVMVKWPGPDAPNMVLLSDLLTGGAPDPQQLPLVLAMLDGHWMTQVVAIRALGCFGKTAADAILARESGRDRPPSDAVWQLLGELRDPRGARLIVERCGDSYLPMAAVEALERIGGPAAADALVDLVESGHELKFPKSWSADATASHTLQKAFEERPAFRRRACSVIAQIGDHHSIALLVGALQDPYRHVRLEAEAALKQAGSTAAPGVVPLLNDAEPAVRLVGLRVLEVTATEREAEPLGRVLRHGTGEERALAASALARAGGPSAAATLGEAWASLNLDTKTEVIRRSAAAKDPAVSQAVIDVASVDPIARVRAFVGSMFGDVLDDPKHRDRAEALLFRLLDDTDDTVADSAVGVLACASDDAVERFASLVDKSATERQRSRFGLVTIRAEKIRQNLARREAERQSRLPERFAKLSVDLSSQRDERPLLAELPAPVSDAVWFSAVCPNVVLAGSPFVLEVWANLYGSRSRAGPYDRRMEKGPVVVARGASLIVTLEIAEFGIRGLRDTMQWLGVEGNASFGVTVPTTVAPGSYLGTATIHVDHLRIATLHFLVDVGTAKRTARVDITGREERVRTAFASYASEDQERVLARVQGMQAILPDLAIFLDVVSLRMGEHWQEQIVKEIASRDAFYLFWSTQASRSKWVDYEWRAAAFARGTDFIDPIPLEVVTPPPELAHLHFGHWTLALGPRRHDNASTDS